MRIINTCNITFFELLFFAIFLIVACSSGKTENDLLTPSNDLSLLPDDNGGEHIPFVLGSTASE